MSSIAMEECESSFCSNQTEKFKSIVMQKASLNKKIDKIRNKFKVKDEPSVKSESYTSMQSSSPVKSVAQEAMMQLMQQPTTSDYPSTSSSLSTSSSHYATSSASSTCSLSSSPQQNLHHIMANKTETDILYGMPDDASSVSSKIEHNEERHHGDDEEEEDDELEYLDSSSMSDEMAGCHDFEQQSDSMLMSGSGNRHHQGGYGNNANTNNSLNVSLSNRTNRFFPDGVVDILNRWFYENQDYPYPDENMTNVLAQEANISAKQVRKWFANKRVRSNKCYKQAYRIKKEPKARKQSLSAKSADLADSYGMSGGMMMLKEEQKYFDSSSDDCFASKRKSSSAKNSNKQRFSCDFSSISMAYGSGSATTANSSNPSSSSSSFTSSSPISQLDYSSHQPNTSPLLLSASLLHNNQPFNRQQHHSQANQQAKMHGDISNHFSYSSSTPSGTCTNSSLRPINDLLQAAALQQQMPHSLNQQAPIRSSTSVPQDLFSMWKHVIDANQSKPINPFKANSDASVSCMNVNANENAHLSYNTSSNMSSTPATSNPTSTFSAGLIGQPRTSSVNAAATALYNQYLIQLFQQNPMAMQAALANKFIMSGRANENALTNATNLSHHFVSDANNNMTKTVKNKASNKRKTQLTNSFLDDASAKTSSTNSTNNTHKLNKSPLNKKSMTTKSPKQMSTSQTMDLNMACKQDAQQPYLNRTSSLFTLASVISQHHQLQQQLEDQQHQAATLASVSDLSSSNCIPRVSPNPTQINSSTNNSTATTSTCSAETLNANTAPTMTSTAVTTTAKKNKINFGVISDLIN